jgi:uncharacterized protein (DUF983 family)
MIARPWKSRASFYQAFSRCLQLLCPACGNASIVKKPFHIRDRCSSCLVRFQREEGFFVGAILINVVSTELVILLAYLMSMVVIGSYYQVVIALLLILALAFPVAFYHHSWSIWLTFDHAVEGLRKS